MNLMQLAQAATRLPHAKALYEQVLRAQAGDAEALAYLKRQGWKDAADLVKPGAGEVLGSAYSGVRAFMRGDVVDAEFSVLDGPPWSGFLSRLLQQPNGAHILIGPPGSGKTTLAVKLAHRFSQGLGYQVNAIGMYPEDVPAFAKTISLDTFVGRIDRLRRYLQATEDQDEDDEEELGGDPSTDAVIEERIRRETDAPARLPPTRRVLIIDEVGLTLSNNPQDPVRLAALRALAQCRHVNWIVLYIGQLLGQFPMGLLGQSTVWIKRPDGREMETDRMDVRMVRDLWTRAGEAFGKLRELPWYRDEWANPKAWAYVDSKSLNSLPGYIGLVPFTPWKPEGMPGDEGGE